MSYNYTNHASSPMIKVAILDTAFNRVKHITTCHVPRIGENVDMGYDPMPVVKGVVWHSKPNHHKIDPLVACVVFVE